MSARDEPAGRPPRNAPRLARAAAGMAAALVLLSAGAGAAGDRPVRKEAGVAQDFAGVTSLPAARRLAAAGRLVPILFFPAEFGGEARAENEGYVTPEAAAARLRIIARMRGMIAQGLLDTLDVEPAYRGDSIVPATIRMKASRKGGAGVYDVTIAVW